MSAIPSRVHKLRVSGSNRRSAIKHAVWVKARCHLPLGEPSLCNLACCVLLLRFFWRAKNNRKVFMKSKWNTPLVQNVEFESLFCVPNAACCHYTTFWIWCRRWDSNPRSVFQASRFKREMYVTPSLGHIIAGLSRLPAPRRAFSEEENILVIRADSHRIHSVTE